MNCTILLLIPSLVQQQRLKVIKSQADSKSVSVHHTSVKETSLSPVFLFQYLSVSENNILLHLKFIRILKTH